MIVGIAVVTLVDWLTVQSNVRFNGVWENALLENARPFAARAPRAEEPKGFRVGDERTEIILTGLHANVPAHVTVVSLATASKKALRVDAKINGRPAGSVAVGGRGKDIEFAGHADRMGRLVIRLYPRMFDRRRGLIDPGLYRFAGVRVRESSRGLVPFTRVCGFALLMAIIVTATSRLSGSPRARIVVAIIAILGLSAAIWSSKLVVLAHLYWIATALFGFVIVDMITVWMGFQRQPGVLLASAIAFRLLVASHPAFPMVDLAFHAHNLWDLRSGQALTSVAPSPSSQPLPVPYPPGLYLMLYPVFRIAPQHDETLVRFAMILLECTAPLVLFALMRSGRASIAAASWGGAFLAAMPQGLLVLAKGIAANIFGNLAWLITMWTLVSRAHPLTLIVAFGMCLLGHFGVTLSLCLFLLIHWLGEWSLNRASARRIFSQAACFVAALLSAWLLYYRQVAHVLLEATAVITASATSSNSAFFMFHGYRIGKLAQNLVLKLGLAPLALVLQASLARADLLGRLLRSWLVTGAILAALAVFTPVVVRFEYLAVPALAALAGLGAQDLVCHGHRRRVVMAWLIAIFIQIIIGAFVLHHRFEIISVIMESRRWPFPLSSGFIG